MEENGAFFLKYIHKKYVRSYSGGSLFVKEDIEKEVIISSL